MKKLLLFAAAAAVLASCAPKTAPELPMETFFRNSEKTGYQISPDGRYFSYMAPYESRRNIFVQPVDGKQAVRITSETERDLAGYFWAGDNRILYLKDTGGDENYQLYGVNIDGSNPKAYTAIPGVRTQIIDPLEEIDSLIIIGTNQRNPMIFDPYRLNLNTGEMTMLCENPGDIQGWQTDHDGRLRVAYAIVDGVNSQIRYRETEAEPFRPVLTTNFKESVSFAAFTPDNKQVYAVTNLGRDKVALVLMAPATCEEIEQLYVNDKYDLDNIWYSDAQKKLLGVSYTGHKGTARHFFDKATGEMFGRMEKHLRGYAIGIAGSNKAEDKYIVYAGGDRTMGTYYLYDVEADTMTKLADLAPWIEEEQMAEMIPINYTSRDGLEIEGYLTLPVGKTVHNAKNLPVVVNPHGGPWARDYWGFNPEAQFLANRGYAVLQMNFRGSTGFGRKFTEIAYGKWGQTMQDDITDGVNWLIGKGIADPAHLRRQLRRLRHAAGHREGSRPLRLRHRLRGRVEPLLVPRNHSALLETDARHDVRDGRQPRKGRRDAAREFAGPQRRAHRDPAAGGAGRQRSPREHQREQPDGRSAAQPRRACGLHGQGQRRPRLPQRGEPFRLLPRDGEVPRQIPQGRRTAGRDRAGERPQINRNHNQPQAYYHTVFLK